MTPDDSLTALRAIPQELRETRATVQKLQEQLEAESRKRADELKAEKRERRNVTAMLTGVIAALALALGIVVWLGEQRNAHNARELCANLVHTRSEIVPVWQQVQFVPGANRPALLKRVDAAEPLAKCLKASSTGR